MSKIKEFLIRVYNFVRYDVWRITEHELSKTRRFLYRIVKTLVISIRGFINDDLGAKASALTYSILFAVVPIIALVISIARGLGVAETIEAFLYDTYVGKMGMVPTVMDFVNRYLETTKGGLFIGVGIAILLWSVMSFFMQVEGAFNDIWHVKKSRAIIRQFTTYFAVILLIPVLLAFSSGFSVYVNSSLSNIFSPDDLISPFLRFGAKFLPYFISWIIFTLMYTAIPNTRVKFTSGLYAGIIAGTIFQLFQMLYIMGQVYLTRYNEVYGAFAAIPLLLLWIRISCLIVLLGAEISYSIQNTHNFEYDTDAKNISIRYRNFLLLFITHVVVKRFEAQETPLSSDDIGKKYKIPAYLVYELLNKLVAAGILIEVYHEPKRAKTYQPYIDINALTVNMLFDKVETDGSELFLKNKNEELDVFWEKMLAIKEKSNTYTQGILIKDI